MNKISKSYANSARNQRREDSSNCRHRRKINHVHAARSVSLRHFSSRSNTSTRNSHEQNRKSSKSLRFERQHQRNKETPKHKSPFPKNHKINNSGYGDSVNANAKMIKKVLNLGSGKTCPITDYSKGSAPAPIPRHEGRSVRSNNKDRNSKPSRESQTGNYNRGSKYHRSSSYYSKVTGTERSNRDGDVPSRKQEPQFSNRLNQRSSASRRHETLSLNIERAGPAIRAKSLERGNRKRDGPVHHDPATFSGRDSGDRKVETDCMENRNHEEGISDQGTGNRMNGESPSNSADNIDHGNGEVSSRNENDAGPEPNIAPFHPIPHFPPHPRFSRPAPLPNWVMRPRLLIPLRPPYWYPYPPPPFMIRLAPGFGHYPRPGYQVPHFPKRRLGSH